MSDPMFRFSMRAAVKDPTGYYYTRWDRAQTMTVVAATQDEAVDKAAKMLGEPERGRCWTFRFDGSDEVHDARQDRSDPTPILLRAQAEAIDQCKGELSSIPGAMLWDIEQVQKWLGGEAKRRRQQADEIVAGGAQ